MRRVVAGVPDLFFAARIGAAGKAAGVPVELVSLAGVREACLAAPVDLVLLDLEAPGAIELVSALKAEPSLARVPVVGFYPHTKVEIFRAAAAAGIDKALARSAFTTLLPALLSGGEPPRG